MSLVESDSAIASTIAGELPGSISRRVALLPTKAFRIPFQ